MFYDLTHKTIMRLDQFLGAAGLKKVLGPIAHYAG